MKNVHGIGSSVDSIEMVFVNTHTQSKITNFLLFFSIKDLIMHEITCRMKLIPVIRSIYRSKIACVKMSSNDKNYRAGSKHKKSDRGLPVASSKL